MNYAVSAREIANNARRQQEEHQQKRKPGARSGGFNEFHRL
jgi:hypothetical protein